MKRILDIFLRLHFCGTYLQHFFFLKCKNAACHFCNKIKLILNLNANFERIFQNELTKLYFVVCERVRVKSFQVFFFSPAKSNVFNQDIAVNLKEGREWMNLLGQMLKGQMIKYSHSTKGNFYDFFTYIQCYVLRCYSLPSWSFLSLLSKFAKHFTKFDKSIRKRMR